MTCGLILYAPSVHTGGGFVLLQSLLSAWQGDERLKAFLDGRAEEKLNLSPKIAVSWVAASACSRLKAEADLRKAAKSAQVVFCFHGLPPILANHPRVVVFLQNRLHLDRISLSGFSFKTKLRLIAERLAARIFRYKVSQYVVQTPAMRRALIEWYSAPSLPSSPKVRILPFFDAATACDERDVSMPLWDFVYPADGQAHKNHKVLLEAWCLLAQDGLYPSLAITLSHRDEELRLKVESVSAQVSLNICNLGQLPRERIFNLYRNARAMIFPSTSESFGLPLVEAAKMGIPILAPELDYVRDVCNPVHSFDPSSAVSVARAVKRFLGNTEDIVALRTPAEFWGELLSNSGYPV